MDMTCWGNISLWIVNLVPVDIMDLEGEEQVQTLRPAWGPRRSKLEASREAKRSVASSATAAASAAASASSAVAASATSVLPLAKGLLLAAASRRPSLAAVLAARHLQDNALSSHFGLLVTPEISTKYPLQCFRYLLAFATDDIALDKHQVPRPVVTPKFQGSMVQP